MKDNLLDSVSNNDNPPCPTNHPRTVETLSDVESRYRHPCSGHGKRPAEYKAWVDAKQRCLNTTHPRYAAYRCGNAAGAGVLSRLLHSPLHAGGVGGATHTRKESV